MKTGKSEVYLCLRASLAEAAHTLDAWTPSDRGEAPLQIVTTRRSIGEYMWRCALPTAEDAVFCAVAGRTQSAYDMRLLSLCLRLRTLSRMFYCSCGKLKKLRAEQYLRGLFAPFAETEAELMDHVPGAPGAEAPRIARMPHILPQVFSVWAHMLANEAEQAFVSEFAYALEYAAEHRGALPPPEFPGAAALRPGNWPDYDPDGHRFSTLSDNVLV